jgi:hypothetical protein
MGTRRGGPPGLPRQSTIRYKKSPAGGRAFVVGDVQKRSLSAARADGGTGCRRYWVRWAVWITASNNACSAAEMSPPALT